jgi:hypothetical protein
MQGYLKKHGQEAAKNRIKVSWKRENDKLIIDFEVQKRNSEAWLSDPVFTEDWSKNWGLWNKDVVEVFVQLREHDQDIKAPYLEIQVSPLNQPFALIITEPRKVFYAPKELHFTHSVSVEGRLWTGHMEVVLPKDLKGKYLFGGFFSIMGNDPREYYALEPNPESNPDFHRPELFLSLEEQ